GSGLKEYRQHQTLHKTPLPAGLLNSSQLPEPVFTPSTKAEEGHDENISFEDMRGIMDPDLAEEVRRLSLRLYRFGAEKAREKNIIIADTKFEFGLQDERLILIDEAMTPDSSRFWPAETYTVGQNQASLDKQYLRDWLETLDWDKTPPPPTLPPEVIANTAAKYQEILKILTGQTLDDILKM
ncbi:MAG TPA: phosphoribosylaminoimidazolesuccinocarboxamide synthase, partial [Calditrichia bacterium]|nr:phosphoribosylaminoimidazolesuccinocarboxamide synthase [Calditrichia bacterium]